MGSQFDGTGYLHGLKGSAWDCLLLFMVKTVTTQWRNWTNIFTEWSNLTSLMRRWQTHFRFNSLRKTEQHSCGIPVRNVTWSYTWGTIMRNVLTFQMVACSHPLCLSSLGISSQKPSLLILSEVSHLRKLHPPLSFLHSTQYNVSPLFIDFLKNIFIIFLFLLNEEAWKDRGLVCFVHWFIPTS